MRQSRYSILIICEGENTEPLFFNSIRDEILKRTYEVDATIDIIKEPNVNQENDSEELAFHSPHKKKRKPKELRKAIVDEPPEEIKGPPPLKWVLRGQKALQDGSHDEVWTVFDHDNHPKRKGAFEAGDQVINGKNVKIAFSSRSFEYYILLHFERIYKAFQKTECKENKISIKCGTSQHANDCHGKECINGYARVKGYWDESKSKKSIFHLVKDRLEIGFENSAWIRFYSDLYEKDIPVYDRNPYINTDKLVKKLTGYEGHQWEWISTSKSINGIVVSITDNFHLKIQNATEKVVIIPPDSFFRINDSNSKKTFFGVKKILSPSDSYLTKIERNKNHVNEYFGFNYKKITILFDYSKHTSKPKALIKQLITLSHKELTNLLDIIKLNIKNDI